MLAGCYERVVSARGIGSDRYSVQPSQRSNTAADRALDGLWQSSPQTISTKSKWSADKITTPNTWSSAPQGAVYRPGISPKTSGPAPSAPPVSSPPSQTEPKK